MMQSIILVVFSTCTLFAGGVPSSSRQTNNRQVTPVQIDEQQFLLYTISNKETPYDLRHNDVPNLRKSRFNPSVPTKFLIHGYTSSCEGDAVQLIKDAYLAGGKVNVICCGYDASIDYRSLSEQAKDRGANTGMMISFLIKQGGLRAEDIHIIGHSLGAHIAGYAAQSIAPTTKIPRITGLDAAAVRFAGKPAGQRLSADDAQYVDCVFTSILGNKATGCGYVDMYVNGGINQPRCEKEVLIKHAICDHSSAYVYWADSIAHGPLPAITCKSMLEAQEDSIALKYCTEKGAVMGDDAIKRTPKGIYFVKPRTTS